MSIYSYRHSILHNICTEMLEKGFHKSFSELFNLVQKQKREHEQAGPAAVLLEPLINSDHAKLEYLRVQLTVAEDAERMGNLEGVYLALRSLAQYFDRNQGMWLSFHFHQRSLEVASRITGDSQRAEGEGQCSVGLAMEKRGTLYKLKLKMLCTCILYIGRRFIYIWRMAVIPSKLCVYVFSGELQSAAGHFELYRNLAHKHRWCTDTGDSVYEIACEHLRRIYTSMATEVNSWCTCIYVF